MTLEKIKNSVHGLELVKKNIEFVLNSMTENQKEFLQGTIKQLDAEIEALKSLYEIGI